MNKLYLTILTLLMSLGVYAQLSNPCDSRATKETKALYYSMQRLIEAGVMFGHHDDTGYGVQWKFKNDSSDVKSTAGSYPAVYGWDLAKIEHDSTKDINGIPFELQKKRVQEAYARGGINTFCWHMDNPADGKSAWDTTQRTISAILPGGAAHDTYVQWLDKAATYLKRLKGKKGEAIPVLFRPFHELTGSWFWWCKNTSSPEEFKAIWRFTVDYLRNTKKLHNLLIVYSVADFDSEAEFLDRYPGDDYVDFMGFDNYCRNNVAYFQSKLDSRMALLNEIATKHNKLSCLAEVGYNLIPQADWWTKVLLPVLVKNKTSYILTWRNADTSQYFAPYPGQASEKDFKDFANSYHIIFQNRLTPLGIYGRPIE
jgi:mannan endo-1,4-beta-mannosidase